MAINPETEFPGKINPSDASYPYGSARNITTPGDGTGTPFVANLVNDVMGFQQALLAEAGIVPSGAPDTSLVSQYLQALKGITAAPVNDMFALVSIPLAQRKAASLFGFFFIAPESSPRGGGPLVWQPTLNKNLATGGDIIDPDTLGGWDGTKATLDSTYYGGSGQGTGVGTGCWVRETSGRVNSEDYGATPSGTAAGNAAAINRSLLTGNAHLPAGTYSCDKIELLSADVATHASFTGDGIGLTKIVSNVSADQSAEFQTAIMSIRDMTFDGNKTATEVRITGDTHIDLVNVQFTLHVGKNCHITSLEAKLDHCYFLPSENNGETSECGLYADWNALEISGQCFFNTQNNSPCIILDDHPSNNELRTVSIENNTFENAPYAVKFVDNISTSAINLLNNHIELVDSANAIGLYIKQGLHESINFHGNHFGTGVYAPVVLDQIDKRSHVSISGTDLYRPVRVFTTASLPATNLDTVLLPALKIDSQFKSFDASDVATDFTPTVIVDDYAAFENLQVDRIQNDQDYAIPKITGRLFAQTPIDTTTSLFKLGLPAAGGTVFGFNAIMDFDVTWRHSTKGAGVSSFQIERHTMLGAFRNTATVAGNSTVTTLSSEGSTLSAAAFVGSTPNEDVSLDVTGNPLATQGNDWQVDFTITMGR